jgi:cysteine synthase A
MIDVAYCVDDRLAFSVCHALAQKEGLLLGASTGAIVAAALADAQHYDREQRMLLLNPDRGDRYLETVYSSDWLTKQQIKLYRDNELIQMIQSLKSIPLDVVSQNASR